jgi:hypothetical protein
MPEWLISLISVIVGAVIGIGGTELVQWWKRPILEVDFEKRFDQYPYIPDFNDETNVVLGYSSRAKCLRLKVKNKGKKPVTCSEAKLEITTDPIFKADINMDSVVLHWSRNDPLLFSKNQDIYEGSRGNAEKIFAPITFNINDEETVDVLQLSYRFRDVPKGESTSYLYSNIESVSLRRLIIYAKEYYFAKVTIYSDNTSPKTFSFIVYWDGTLDGFNKAFSRFHRIKIRGKYKKLRKK